MVAESLDMVYAYAQAVREALSKVDVLASPTVPIAAPEIGAEMVGTLLLRIEQGVGT